MVFTADLLDAGVLAAIQKKFEGNKEGLGLGCGKRSPLAAQGFILDSQGTLEYCSEDFRSDFLTRAY